MRLRKEDNNKLQLNYKAERDHSVIDRDRICQVFSDYTSLYDTSDEKVKLKIDHTYRVADICEEIARAEGMSPADADLAWLLGMLHDVGRFEQLRRYGTFVDADSIDHAKLGADLLFMPNDQVCISETYNGVSGEISNMNPSGIFDMIPGGISIDDFLEKDRIDESDLHRIETAIRVHNAYRIPDHMDFRTIQYCHILRDADKIDILRVNIDTPLEAIYNVSTHEVRNCVVSDVVMEAFFEEHAVLRALKKTTADHIVSFIAFVYELVYPKSVHIVRKQGYLEQLFDYPTDNEETKQQFSQLKMYMKEYLKRRTGVEESWE